MSRIVNLRPSCAAARIAAVVMSAAMLLSTVGCATARIDAPAGYVPMREPRPFEFKAVSSRGCVITASTVPNENAKADLAFWTAALEHEKVTLNRWKLVGREAVKAADGVAGNLLRFEMPSGASETTGYVVAIFVTAERIRLVEAAGPAAWLAEDLEAIRKAVASSR